MIRSIIAALGLVVAGLPAVAQSPTSTRPHNVTSTNASGTITATGPFQQVFAAATGPTGQTIAMRSGCSIQNNSAANPMYVFFGPIASATQANSLKLVPGAIASCASGVIVLRDQVSVSGTAADPFYAAVQ